MVLKTLTPPPYDTDHWYKSWPFTIRAVIGREAGYTLVDCQSITGQQRYPFYKILIITLYYDGCFLQGHVSHTFSYEELCTQDNQPCTI